MNPKYTVKSNRDFRRIYAKGDSAVTPHLVVYCRKNRSDTNRTGYTVSVKIGGAVVRNRIKRQFREIYRLNSPRIRSGYDIIMVARNRAANGSYAEIEADFLTAVKSLGLLAEEEA